MTLAGAPRREVIRAQPSREPRPFGGDTGSKELARVHLLVRGVEADDCHHRWVPNPSQATRDDGSGMSYRNTRQAI